MPRLPGPVPLRRYLADLLRNDERLAAFTDADGWAKGKAMPSGDEHPSGTAEDPSPEAWTGQ
ncbi:MULTISPECIES: hypothetical protein [Streptomyces]|uniref:Uncharacterized protein n=1 Tax=Streptomyces lonegramiae TaxID=3075524 RepID=A0ABU2XNI2_9ACTN|nr:hypothetical protein [Streptomyces sp. DSM 41529]MDT0547492.1 hypothetical protein [Streptomyces sp. DSM 41529]